MWLLEHFKLLMWLALSFFLKSAGQNSHNLCVRKRGERICMCVTGAIIPVTVYVKESFSLSLPPFCVSVFSIKNYFFLNYRPGERWAEDSGS